jgi:hypothetical protein
MRKIFKPLIVLSLITVFAVFSVLCCCTASAVMAHLQKKVMYCSHCHQEPSKGKPSNNSESCHHQYLGAEYVVASNIFTAHTIAFYPAIHVFDHHKILAPILLRAYPPGGPPLGINFTPLYLRTFQLRI